MWLKINGACMYIDCIFCVFFSEPNDLQIMQPVLRNVTKYGSPILISFSEMMGLMTSCQSLETPNLEKRPEAKQISRSARRVPRNLLSNTFSNPIALFNGIVPGEANISNSINDFFIWSNACYKNVVNSLFCSCELYILKYVFRYKMVWHWWHCCHLLWPWCWKRPGQMLPNSRPVSSQAQIVPVEIQYYKQLYLFKVSSTLFYITHHWHHHHQEWGFERLTLISTRMVISFTSTNK